MANRFGSTATLVYQTGDSITAGTTVVLTADVMPNYQFDTSADTDRQIHTTKTGRKYAYANYNLQSYTFTFSNLSEAMRGTLKTMWDAMPLLTFNTNGSLWGTFRFGDSSWSDQEIAFGLFDLEFSLVQDS